MGKASRRRRTDDRSAARASARASAVPFRGRPFEGLPAETEWVAIREILPAATATVSLTGAHAPVDGPTQATIATVLPMAWPGLHRADGTVFVATQAGHSSGDASRDLAAQILAAAALDPGTPLAHAPAITADTPRLEDLLDVTAPFEVTLHEGFDFWVEGQELDADGRDSLERANESVVPTVRLSGLPSAYWVRLGERTYIRLVLPEEENLATDALARLAAAGTASLGEGTRLLGAFRACGLLVPVWELDAEAEPESYDGALSAFGERYAAALAAPEPLTPEERRARSGLLSRQVTLR
jgi:hypothetical protein